MLDEIRKDLVASYKHKLIEGKACVECGRTELPFALHVIEYYHADSIPTPSYFVPMSQSRGTIRGSVPLCKVCCPPCNSCSLPITAPWIKKIVHALKTQHQDISFVAGSGFCRHLHVLNDLKSVLFSSKLAGITATPTREEKSSVGGAHKWNNQELSVYFTSRPDDPVWGAVTKENAEIIQHGFLEIWQRAELEKYKDSNSLPVEVIDAICDIANDVGENHNLNPTFIILIVHQYVDADPLMRQLHKNRWLASMVARSDYAPPPESSMRYIKSTYFSVSEY